MNLIISGKRSVGRTSNSKVVILNPSFIEKQYALPDPFKVEFPKKMKGETKFDVFLLLIVKYLLS